jgi:hypothetical protein
MSVSLNRFSQRLPAFCCAIGLGACLTVYLLEMMHYRRILRKTPTRISPQPDPLSQVIPAS